MKKTYKKKGAARPKAYRKKSYKKKLSLKKVNKKVVKLEKEVELKQIDIVPNGAGNATTVAAGTLKYVTNFSRYNTYQATGAGSTGVGAGMTSSVPFYTLLNPCLKGTSLFNRLADKVKFTSLAISGNFIINQGGFAFPGCENHASIRVMLVKMKKPRGTSIQLYASTQSAGSTPLFWMNGAQIPDVWSKTDTGLGSNAYEQYKILYDKTRRYGMGAQSATYNGSGITVYDQQWNQPFKINVKLGMVTDYSRSNNGDISDIEANALYLVMLTDYSARVSIQYDMKLYFKDS